jgi:hypothetical protein
VALGQVFLRVVGFPLSISFHWCSIIVKLGKKLHIFITGVAQEALRLRCVRSIYCGALHHAKKKKAFTIKSTDTACRTGATQLCRVLPNICGSSARKFLHVTHLTSRSLRWILDFWKICVPLLQVITNAH